jgi:hypothetical protein
MSGKSGRRFAATPLYRAERRELSMMDMPSEREVEKTGKAVIAGE